MCDGIRNDDNLRFEREKWDAQVHLETQKLELEEQNRAFDLELKRKEQGRAKWMLVIQAIGIIGGVLTFFLAFLQYKDNSNKEARATLVHAMQITDTSQYKRFYEDLNKLYYAVDSNSNPAAQQYLSNRNNSDKAYEYFKKYVLGPNRIAFDNTLAFFNMLNDYTTMGPCYSESIRLNLSGEAVLFIWYFDPIFQKYATDFRHVKPEDLYGGLYTIAQLPKNLNCEVK